MKKYKKFYTGTFEKKNQKPVASQFQLTEFPSTNEKMKITLSQKEKEWLENCTCIDDTGALCKKCQELESIEKIGGD